MSLENHPACRTANKVAMLMRYVASIPDAKSANSVIDEALLQTLELFQRSDLETISANFAMTSERLTQVPEATQCSPQVVAQWTTDACDLLRTMGFQEKLIAVLGDELHRWQFELASASEFERSLTQLANDCSSGATETTLTQLARDARAATKSSDIDRFSLAVCGLAIVLASNTGPDDSRPAEASPNLPVLDAMSCFGGHLVAGRTQRFR